MKEDQNVERLAADQILDRGARMKMRAPFLLRIIGIKEVSLTVRAPYEGTLHRVASYYLSTGLSSEKLENLTHEEALGIMVAHGKSLRRAVACAWLNGYWTGKLFTKPLAHYMKWHCKPVEISTIAMLILIYGGAADFMSTTRSVRMMKITTPKMGQKDQGS